MVLLDRKKIAPSVSSDYVNPPGNVDCKIQYSLDGVKTALDRLDQRAVIACPYNFDPNTWMQFDMQSQFHVAKVILHIYQSAISLMLMRPPHILLTRPRFMEGGPNIGTACIMFNLWLEAFQSTGVVLFCR